MQHRSEQDGALPVRPETLMGANVWIRGGRPGVTGGAIVPVDSMVHEPSPESRLASAVSTHCARLEAIPRFAEIVKVSGFQGSVLIVHDERHLWLVLHFSIFVNADEDCAVEIVDDFSNRPRTRCGRFVLHWNAPRVPGHFFDRDHRVVVSVERPLHRPFDIAMDTAGGG